MRTLVLPLIVVALGCSTASCARVVGRVAVATATEVTFMTAMTAAAHIDESVRQAEQLDELARRRTPLHPAGPLELVDFELEDERPESRPDATGDLARRDAWVPQAADAERPRSGR